MNKRKGRTQKVQDRIKEAFKLRQAGYTQQEIADQLGIHQTVVSDYLKDSYEKLREEQAEESKHYARLDMSRLDNLLKALQAGVERGESRAISTAIKVLERRAKLLGLDAPTKQQVEINTAKSAEDIERELKAALEQHNQTPKKEE